MKSRFDLFAQDSKNRIIVDIQHERYADHYHRFMHYHLAAILEQVAGAKAYQPPMTVFTIVVLTSGDKHKRDILITDFDPRDRKGNPVTEIKHKVIYLCPKYVTDETPEPFRSWMLAIQDTLDEEVDETAYESPVIRRIFDYIEKDSVTPAERARMFDEYGLEQLQDEKYVEGKIEGKVEGKVEGLVEGKTETARKMKAKGYETEEIADLTGLPVEEINAIAI